jgi:hypothetical protein
MEVEEGRRGLGSPQGQRSRLNAHPTHRAGPRGPHEPAAAREDKENIAMLKIYGNPMSTCTRKVLMTLAETNTPFEMTVVDFSKGEHKQGKRI